MIIVRAPVRLSFAGGGTDLPAFFRRYGGAVVSTTIDKYVYVVITRNDDGLQIISSDYNSFYRYRRGETMLLGEKFALPGAVLQDFGIREGLSLFISSEIPPGSGLGSSSAVTVALVKALSLLQGQECSSEEVARRAVSIELDRLNMPIGYQDQHASACGGFNFMEFSEAGTRVTPLSVSPETLRQLENNLLLFFMGTAHNSSDILYQQRYSTEKKNNLVIDSLKAVKDMAYEVRDMLQKGNLSSFGELLHNEWEHKKNFADGISNPVIDEAYAVARAAGALGGKLPGAGGGGFMLLYAEDGAREAVTGIMEARGMQRMEFRFENEGVRVLLND